MGLVADLDFLDEVMVVDVGTVSSGSKPTGSTGVGPALRPLAIVE